MGFVFTASVPNALDVHYDLMTSKVWRKC